MKIFAKNFQFFATFNFNAYLLGRTVFFFRSPDLFGHRVFHVVYPVIGQVIQGILVHRGHILWLEAPRHRQIQGHEVGPVGGSILHRGARRNIHLVFFDRLRFRCLPRPVVVLVGRMSFERNLIALQSLNLIKGIIIFMIINLYYYQCQHVYYEYILLST